MNYRDHLENGGGSIDIIRLIMNCWMLERAPVDGNMTLEELFKDPLYVESKACSVILNLPPCCRKLVYDAVNMNDMKTIVQFATDLVAVVEGSRKYNKATVAETPVNPLPLNEVVPKRKSVFSEERLGKNWKSFRKA